MTLNPDKVEAQARELLERRISSVRALVSARQTLEQLRDQVAELEAADAKAFRSALSDGWSVEELRAIGLSEPDKKSRARRRAARQSASTHDPRVVEAVAQPASA